jgi:hypothetical protein
MISLAASFYTALAELRNEFRFYLRFGSFFLHCRTWCLNVADSHSRFSWELGIQSSSIFRNQCMAGAGHVLFEVFQPLFVQHDFSKKGLADFSYVLG